MEKTERWLQKEHADVVVLQGDDAKWQQLLSRSNYRVADESQTNFFLVDPDGFCDDVLQHAETLTKTSWPI
jgi:hypothetical protein